MAKTLKFLLEHLPSLYQKIITGTIVRLLLGFIRWKILYNLSIRKFSPFLHFFNIIINIRVLFMSHAMQNLRTLFVIGGRSQLYRVRYQQMFTICARIVSRTTLLLASMQ